MLCRPSASLEIDREILNATLEQRSAPAACSYPVRTATHSSPLCAVTHAHSCPTVPAQPSLLCLCRTRLLQRWCSLWPAQAMWRTSGRLKVRRCCRDSRLHVVAPRHSLCSLDCSLPLLLLTGTATTTMVAPAHPLRTLQPHAQQIHAIQWNHNS